MDEVFCPKCHRPMTKRTAKKTGKSFWGCPAFFPAGPRNPEGYDSTKGEKQCDGVIWHTPGKKEVVVRRGIPQIVGSAQQKAIWEEMEKGKSHVMIEALPGCGKTTTIAVGCDRLKGSICALAFSKKIERALTEMMPERVTCKTFHAFGWHILLSQLPKKPTLSANKTLDLIDQAGVIPQGMKDEEAWPVKKAIADLISKCKATLTEPTPDNLDLLCDKFDIAANGNADLVFRAVPVILERSARLTTICDHDDQQWLPIVLNLPFPKYDNVLVDECQDTCAVRTEMIFRVAGERGRIIVVGDENQSIFGFTGSDPEAMPNLRARLAS